MKEVKNENRKRKNTKYKIKKKRTWLGSKL